jgi:hypothetical protein
VRSVSPNCLTGSVVVEYDSRLLPPVALFEAMRKGGIACTCPATATIAKDASTSLAERLAEVAAARLFESFIERLAVSLILAVI